MSDAPDQVDDEGDDGFDQAVQQFEADNKPAQPEPDTEVKAKPETESAEDTETEDTESEDDTAPDDADTEAAPDIWAGLTEAQQAELERIRQRDRSNAGRVSSTQREINRLKRELEQAAAATPAAPQAPATEGEVAETPKATPARPTTESQEAQAERVATEFRLQMYEARPDWADIASSEQFQKWGKEQPAYIQSLMQQDNADAALTVLSLWDESQKNTARADKARKLTEQRSQRLAESRETNGGKSAPPAGGDSDDDGDAGFELGVKMFEKEQRAARRF